MKKIISFLLTSLSFVALASEVQVKKSALFVPHTLGKVALTYDGNQFHVKQNSKKYPVQNYLIDSKLRNINAAQLKALQKVGYIAVNKTSDGEFTLKSNVRGLGGGPILGCITAITGGVVTGVATAAAFIAAFPSGPGAVAAAVATAHAGMAATAYATLAATAAPTP